MFWENKNPTQDVGKKSTVSVFRRFRPPGAVFGPRGLQKRAQDEKPRPMDPGRGPGTNSERISVRGGVQRCGSEGYGPKGEGGI